MHACVYECMLCMYVQANVTCCYRSTVTSDHESDSHAIHRKGFVVYIRCTCAHQSPGICVVPFVHIQSCMSLRHVAGMDIATHTYIYRFTHIVAPRQTMSFLHSIQSIDAWSIV